MTVADHGVIGGRGRSTIADEARILWAWYPPWHKDAQGNNIRTVR